MRLLSWQIDGQVSQMHFQNSAIVSRQVRNAILELFSAAITQGVFYVT